MIITLHWRLLGIYDSFRCGKVRASAWNGLHARACSATVFSRCPFHAHRSSQACLSFPFFSWTSLELMGDTRYHWALQIALVSPNLFFPTSRRVSFRSWSATRPTSERWTFYNAVVLLIINGDVEPTSRALLKMPQYIYPLWDDYVDHVFTFAHLVFMVIAWE